ncbi:DMT family transporter [Lutimaribacter marinistellae]|uniref:DMT family transporter n=1 Tax=Lutimaribacter marinistellae TaxID=1820329 RepID=A0ABV7TCV0_9RHOB
MRDRASGGLLFGLAAVVAWAVYNVGVEMGHAQGFASADLTLLRYAGGAAAMVPLLLLARANPFAGPGVLRLAVLVMVAGPPFAWAINTGYALAPLSHAVVIGPGMTMLVATGLTRATGGTAISPNRMIGMALVVIGLVIMATDAGKPGNHADGMTTLLGDLCFVVSGTLWGVFTWAMGYWRLDALRSTGAIALVSTVLYLPLYLVLFDPPRLPGSLWVEQVMYQGLLGGALAVVFFTASVRRLGGDRAAVFPALVPMAAVLVSVPMIGQWPNLQQWAGISTASLGLLVSLDLAASVFRRWGRSQDRGKASQ